MRIGTFVFILFLLFSCSKEQEHKAEAPRAKSCRDCHQVHLDQAHDLGCLRCHGGKEPAAGKAQAHQGLVRAPAAPAYMRKTCGPCHPKETRSLPLSLHYTLASEVNTVRGLFGLPPVASAETLPEPERIKDVEDLVNDLLRRRCLRCHLFFEGDDYAETRHGLGCAACHLPFAGGSLEEHVFQGPGDRECLHCHYGNRVGWDYYGLAEHDYPFSFRSPLVRGHLPPRPWGVEFHELRPDVHLQAGMSCLACHKKDQLMGKGKGPLCLDCHRLKKTLPFHAPRVLSKARCSACHARWSFWDEGVYLALLEDPDWEEWSELMVQGSSEVEEALTNFLQGKQTRAVMRDKFSQRIRKGIWLLSLGKRRFEEVHLGWDREGRLAVLRPLGDLHLTYVDQEGEAIFDDLTPPKGARLLPYAPHTIGTADYARTQKVLKRIGIHP